jgi:glycerol-3-phosphate dehydrogenase
MAEELKWDSKRKEVEWKNSVKYLGSMGLPKSKLSLSRKDVESGKVGKYLDEEYNLYARHGMFTVSICKSKMSNANLWTDKPDEVLPSDSKYPKGHNPVIGDDTIPEGKANKN